MYCTFLGICFYYILQVIHDCSDKLRFNICCIQVWIVKDGKCLSKTLSPIIKGIFEFIIIRGHFHVEKKLKRKVISYEKVEIFVHAQFVEFIKKCLLEIRPITINLNMLFNVHCRRVSVIFYLSIPHLNYKTLLGAY